MPDTDTLTLHYLRECGNYYEIYKSRYELVRCIVPMDM